MTSKVSKIKREISSDERRREILNILEEQSSVQVNDLAELFEVSKVTIRNDLKSLESNGKLRRTHGGAISISRRLSVSIQEKRLNVNVEAKKRIANLAASTVCDGDVLLIDSGTTSLELIRRLNTKRNLQIITADFTIADTIDRLYPQMKVVMLGGDLRAGHRYTCGPITLTILNSLYADKAFLCPTSYIPGKGFLTNYPPMAELKKSFAKNAGESYIMMDESKINSSGLVKFGDLTDFDAIIMDKDSKHLIADRVKETTTKLILP